MTRERSVADEPGCRQFDIVQLEATSNAVLFYEVYDNRAAFDAHLETPHLGRFRAGFPALIVAERPVRFARAAASVNQAGCAHEHAHRDRASSAPASWAFAMARLIAEAGHHVRGVEPHPGQGGAAAAPRWDR